MDADLHARKPNSLLSLYEHAKKNQTGTTTCKLPWETDPQGTDRNEHGKGNFEAKGTEGKRRRLRAGF